MNFFISSYINTRHLRNTPKYNDIKHLRNIAIKHIVASEKYSKSYISNDDLIANVMTAIWYADSSYSEIAPQSLESRRQEYCNFELKKYRSQQKKRLKPKSKQYYQDFENIDLLDLLNTKSLSTTETDILVNRYIFNMTFKEIASKLGTSSQNVFKVHKSALATLKKEYNK